LLPLLHFSRTTVKLRRYSFPVRAAPGERAAESGPRRAGRGERAAESGPRRAGRGERAAAALFLSPSVNALYRILTPYYRLQTMSRKNLARASKVG